MPHTLDIEAVRKLSVSERLNLWRLIWQTLAEEDANLLLSPEWRAEIQRRDNELDEHPESAISHEEMRARLNALKSRMRA